MTQVQCHHSPDLEIKEAFPQEVGIRSIQSSDKGGDGVDDSITKWPEWSWKGMESAHI